MSKRINVNPGQYKVAGREHQGEDIVHDFQRQAYAQQLVRAERWPPRRREAPERPASPARENVRQVQAGRTPATKVSRATAPKPKARANRTSKAARAPKTAPKKRKAPARKTRAAASTKRS